MRDNNQSRSCLENQEMIGERLNLEKKREGRSASPKTGEVPFLRKAAPAAAAAASPVLGDSD